MNPRETILLQELLVELSTLEVHLQAQLEDEECQSIRNAIEEGTPTEFVADESGNVARLSSFSFPRHSLRELASHNVLASDDRGCPILLKTNGNTDRENGSSFASTSH